MRCSVWGEFGIAVVSDWLQADKDVATATTINRKRFIRIAGTSGAKAPSYRRAYGTAEAVPSRQSIRRHCRWFGTRQFGG